MCACRGTPGSVRACVYVCPSEGVQAGGRTSERVCVHVCVCMRVGARLFSAVLNDFFPLYGRLTYRAFAMPLGGSSVASVCIHWWGAVLVCGIGWRVWAWFVPLFCVTGAGAGAVGARLGAWVTLVGAHGPGGVPAHPCTYAPAYAQKRKPVHACVCGHTPVCVWVRSGARAPASL